MFSQHTIWKMNNTQVSDVVWTCVVCEGRLPSSEGFYELPDYEGKVCKVCKDGE